VGNTPQTHTVIHIKNQYNIMANIPVNQPPVDHNAAGKRNLVIMGVLLGLVLIANIAYYFLKPTTISQEVASQQVTTAVSAQKASYEELDLRYQAAMHMLDSLKLVIPEKEQKIAEQQAQLEQQRQQIAARIESGDLVGAKQQIEELTRQKDQFVLDLNRLRSENQHLRSQLEQSNTTNQKLQSSNADLSEQLVSEQQTNTTRQDELAAIKAQRDAAERRLEAQAYLPLTSVKAKPVKVSSKGKSTVVKNARDVDQINITFDLPASELVPNGKEVFYIQIIDPNTTVNSQTMRDPRTGKEFAYTTTQEHNYSGQAEQVTFNWAPSGQKLVKGKYTVVVWHRGREVGKSTFELKSSFL
jgi:hypothetical protein